MAGLTICLVFITTLGNMLLSDRVFSKIHMMNIKEAVGYKQTHAKSGLMIYDKERITIDVDEVKKIQENNESVFKRLKIPFKQAKEE